MRVRKKPVEVEAWPWGEYPDDSPVRYPQPGIVVVKTLEGLHHATEGDWLIKGVKGEYYFCKPDIFAETYEVITEEVNNDNS